MQTHNIESSVYSISIELNVLSATSAVRFPCLFSVQWKTNDQKVNLQTSKHTPEAGKTQFNQTLLMKLPLVYDKTKHLFAKKQTLVQLNLVSKIRPDQPKLVGRITIDLANILNKGLYSLPTEFSLQFCSVNAALLLAFKVVQKVQTDISVSQVEKSMGEALQLNNSNRLSGVSAVKDKSRDSSPFTHDFTPLSTKNAETSQPHRRQFTQISQTSSVKQPTLPTKDVASEKNNIESIKDVKQPITQEKNSKQVKQSNQNIQSRLLPKQKQEITLPSKQNEIVNQVKVSPSVKQLRAVTSSKTIVSTTQIEQVRVADSKILEDVSKQKSQLQKLKLQNQRQHQEQQKYRFQIERQKKQVELLKLQSRQKQGSLDEANHEANSLKAEISRLREEANTHKQQVTSTNTKLAQLRDTNNKLTFQLNIAEKKIKQLTGVQKLVQESEGAKSQLSSKLRDFARQLQQSQNKSYHLQKQKYELEGALLRLNQDAQTKEQSYSAQITLLQTDNRSLKEELDRQITVQIEKTNQIDVLQQQNQKFKNQIQNLQNIVKQYSSGKQSLLLQKQNLLFQSQQQSQRIKEIEETLIILQEKIRQLQKQNKTITQNHEHKSQQFEQLISQKISQISKLSEQVARWEDETKKYKSLLEQQIIAKQNTQSRNVTLQQQLIALNDRFTVLGSENQQLVIQHQTLVSQHEILATQKTNLTTQHQKLNSYHQVLTNQHLTLTSQHQRLSNQYSSLLSQHNSHIQIHKTLQAAHSELNQKYNLLQELLITTNQQKIRETDQANLRQQTLNQKVAELTTEVNQTKHYAQVGQERMKILQRQLSDRQNMISRLQEGLTHQIQRNQELNNQLGNEYERQERFKLTINVLQGEFKRMQQLLMDQQVKDSLNIELIKQKEVKIEELNALISSKTESYQSLQSVIDESSKRTLNEIASLNSIIDDKSNRISQLQSFIAERHENIAQLERNHSHTVSTYEQRIKQQQKYIQNLKNQLAALESVKNSNEVTIMELESRIAKLQSEFFNKQSELNAQIKLVQDKLVESQRVATQYKQSDQYNKLLITETQTKYDELTVKYSELQNEFTLKQALSKQEAIRYDSEIRELQQNNEAFKNDKQLFDIIAHRKQLKDKINEVVRLQGELHLLKVQNSKIANLQRAVKIKTIELNSVKFRSKNDSSQNKSELSELLQLKEEQIAALSLQKNRLLNLDNEVISLRQKVDFLNEQLQILEEEKFNIESKCNQTQLGFEELKDQNRKLVDEITIISDRNTELQKILEEIQNKQTNAKDPKGEKSLLAQNLTLKKQIKQMDILKNKISSLEQERKKLQKEIQTQKSQQTPNQVTEQLKSTKTLPKQSTQHSPKKNTGINSEDQKNIVLLNNAYKSLKELITTRIKGKNEQKLIELLETFLNNQTQKSISLHEKSKTLSKQFQKLKIHALKKNTHKEDDKSQLVQLFKLCETIINELLSLP